MKHVSVRFLIGLSGGERMAPSCRERLAVQRLSASYPAGTFLNGRGVWKGAHEYSLVFEAIVEEGTWQRELARSVARTLAQELGQECIGLSFIPCEFELIQP